MLTTDPLYLIKIIIWQTIKEVKILFSYPQYGDNNYHPFQFPL